MSKDVNNIVLRLQGNSFYCECGCNVFQHFNNDPDKYKCNACGNVFDSEPSDPIIVEARDNPDSLTGRAYKAGVEGYSYNMYNRTDDEVKAWHAGHEVRQSAKNVCKEVLK